MATPLTMYIILRKDLAWPTGPLIAQASHAAIAVLSLYKDNENALKYLSDLENMHKVVLQVKTLAKLEAIRDVLIERDLLHHCWIETPEVA
jgi:peptidyl-tRNA hydrolase